VLLFTLIVTKFKAGARVSLKGDQATLDLENFRFWRITHFKAAISRIGYRRFVNNH